MGIPTRISLITVRDAEERQAYITETAQENVTIADFASEWLSARRKSK